LEKHVELLYGLTEYVEASDGELYGEARNNPQSKAKGFQIKRKDI